MTDSLPIRNVCLNRDELKRRRRALVAPHKRYELVQIALYEMATALSAYISECDLQNVPPDTDSVDLIAAMLRRVPESLVVYCRHIYGIGCSPFFPFANFMMLLFAGEAELLNRLKKNVKQSRNTKTKETPKATPGSRQEQSMKIARARAEAISDEIPSCLARKADLWRFLMRQMERVRKWRPKTVYRCEWDASDATADLAGFRLVKVDVEEEKWITQSTGTRGSESAFETAEREFLYPTQSFPVFHAVLNADYSLRNAQQTAEAAGLPIYMPRRLDFECAVTRRLDQNLRRAFHAKLVGEEPLSGCLGCGDTIGEWLWSIRRLEVLFNESIDRPPQLRPNRYPKWGDTCVCLGFCVCKSVRL